MIHLVGLCVSMKCSSAGQLEVFPAKVYFAPLSDEPVASESSKYGMQQRV